MQHRGPTPHHGCPAPQSRATPAPLFRTHRADVSTPRQSASAPAAANHRAHRQPWPGSAPAQPPPVVAAIAPQPHGRGQPAHATRQHRLQAFLCDHGLECPGAARSMTSTALPPRHVAPTAHRKERQKAPATTARRPDCQAIGPRAPPPTANGRLAAPQRLRTGALPWGVRVGGLLHAAAPTHARRMGPRALMPKWVQQVRWSLMLAGPEPIAGCATEPPQRRAPATGVTHRRGKQTAQRPQGALKGRCRCAWSYRRSLRSM